MPTQKTIVKRLLDQHGQTFAEQLGIKLESGTPSALFQWLTAAILYSARIDSDIATASQRELKRHGWRTARSMADSNWNSRVAALTDGGYTRYRERTATMLGDTAELLMDRYRGDLRKLRDAAERDPKAERKLLKQCKGLGDVGVDIFFRETQVVWSELAPFADKRALKTAARLDLADDASGLRKLVSSDADLARLVAGLIRVDLARDLDAILS